MKRPRLLDLFCCAGGAAVGYQRAGFDVVGVDNRPQPRFPFEFILADALTLSLDFLRGFDMIHASPPCQAWARTNNIHKIDHPRLIEPIRAMLRRAGVLYAIENVPGAPLERAFTLCGTMFNLGVTVRGQAYELRRHRLFECNFFVLVPPCTHSLPVIGVYGHGESKPMRGKRGFQISQVAHRRAVMEMPWANRDEIAEAIPPSYSEFVGRAALQHLYSHPVPVNAPISTNVTSTIARPMSMAVNSEARI